MKIKHFIYILLLIATIFIVGCDQKEIERRRRAKRHYLKYGFIVHIGTLKEIKIVWEKCHHPGNRPKCCIGKYVVVFEDGHEINVPPSTFRSCRKVEHLRLKIGEYGQLQETGVWRDLKWIKLVPAPAWDSP